MVLFVHTGKHHANFGMVPYPSKRPLGRSALFICLIPYGLDLFRGFSTKVASPKRFHDHNTNPLGSSISEAFPASLVLLVKIVVLNLAEIPVIVVRKKPGKEEAE